MGFRIKRETLIHYWFATGQRRRRYANIKSTSDQRPLFASYTLKQLFSVEGKKQLSTCVLGGGI